MDEGTITETHPGGEIEQSVYSSTGLINLMHSHWTRHSGMTQTGMDSVTIKVEVILTCFQMISGIGMIRIQMVSGIITIQILMGMGGGIQTKKNMVPTLGIINRIRKILMGIKYRTLSMMISIMMGTTIPMKSNLVPIPTITVMFL